MNHHIDAKVAEISQEIQRLKKPSVSSAQAHVENAGPVSSFALARGSLPVSSDEVLDISRDLLALATKQEQASREAGWEHTPAERAAMARNARVLEHCAGILRRHVVAASVRQPEEAASPRLRLVAYRSVV